MSDSTNNPALEQAQSELTDIMENPSNPRHSGYMRSDKSVLAYVDGLFKNAVGDGKVEFGEGIDIPSRSISVSGEPERTLENTSPNQGENEEQELTADQEQTLETLRTDWGDSFEENMMGAKIALEGLTEGVPPEVLDSEEMIDLANDPRVIRALAEIGKYKRQ